MNKTFFFLTAEEFNYFSLLYQLSINVLIAKKNNYISDLVFLAIKTIIDNCIYILTKIITMTYNIIYFFMWQDLIKYYFVTNE
jgi:hypothetical protein